MAISTYVSIITLNVDGLNASIKRHRVADWIKNQEPAICCLKRDSLQGKRHTQTESKGSKRKQQESGGSNTHIRQSRL